MNTLTYDCPICGGGIESLGRDASSREAVAEFKAEHTKRHGVER